MIAGLRMGSTAIFMSNGASPVEYLPTYYLPTYHSLPIGRYSPFPCPSITCIRRVVPRQGYPPDGDSQPQQLPSVLYVATAELCRAEASPSVRYFKVVHVLRDV